MPIARAKLESAKVYRGGATRTRLKLEQEGVSAYTNIQYTEPELNVGFDIASKGGGETAVILEFGEKDLDNVFDMLAKQYPKQMVKAFTKHLNTAVKHILKESK